MLPLLLILVTNTTEIDLNWTEIQWNDMKGTKCKPFLSEKGLLFQMNAGYELLGQRNKFLGRPYPLGNKGSGSNPFLC